jgi:hypothetical protein
VAARGAAPEEGVTLALRGFGFVHGEGELVREGELALGRDEADHGRTLGDDRVRYRPAKPKKKATPRKTRARKKRG